jgi:hypothetical protein
LIEPPFDATIVEIDSGGVSRSARRLGEVGEPDPVFTPDEERWRWDGQSWG